MTKKNVAIHFLVLFILLSCYSASYIAVRNQSKHHALAAESLFGIWNLPPMALNIVAGEFKGILSDFLTLHSGAQLGTEVVRKPGGGLRVKKKNIDWHNISKMMEASQTLDPSFSQTYIIAEGYLPWPPVSMVVTTQKILYTASQHRTWDWRPDMERGFNAYYFLQKPVEAGKIFLEAAKRPNAPLLLPLLGARLTQKGGETKAAIAMMKTMLANKRQSDPRYGAILKRLHALEGVLILEQAVKKYQQATGQFPASLQILVSYGLLTGLPPNPYKNTNYCLGSKGHIYFDEINCRE